MERRPFAILAAVTALVVLVAVVLLGPAEPLDEPAPAQAPVEERASESEGDVVEGAEGARAEEAFEEAQEQAEKTEKRLEALEEAVAAGEFGTAERVTRDPAPGWAGERVVDPRTDDWEPAIAADPSDPFVYVLTTRYGEPKPCQGNCPIPHIAFEISRDGGRTWSEGRPLCACKGSGQFDPIIEVVPDTGHVVAVWMNGFNVVFQRSKDHGKTWSDPVPTWGKVSWNDKPVLTTSDDGKHVYVSWNGPLGGDPWVAQSHDGGKTWTQRKLSDNDRYFFAYDADVLPDGTVIFSEGSLSYTGTGAAAEGKVTAHAFVSRDRGRTWSTTVIDRVEVGVPCTSEACYADFYDGHTSVSTDADGDLVYTYGGAERPGGPRSIKVVRSTDEGRTWSAPVVVSTRGENAIAPAIEATGDGDVRLWFAQTNGRPHRWNVWYRRSRDLGRTWSKPVKISDASSGARYKHPDGFQEFYGDYGEIDVTSSGETIGVWGEAFSYLGPGGAWFNRGR